MLDSFADAIVDLEEEQADLIEYVESIDEDLADMEDDIYEDEEDDYEESDDSFSYVEMECPNCGDLVDIDEDLLYNDDIDVICPNCQAIILSSDDDDSYIECTEICDCDDDL